MADKTNDKARNSDSTRKRSMYRVAHDEENPYLQVSKGMLRDPKLSLKAKGLLSFMLAKPDDWSTYLEEVASELKEGRNCIARIVEELRAQGYCDRATLMQGNLIAGYEYAFHEKRSDAVAQAYREEKDKKAAKKAESRTNPRKPHSGFTENGALLNTDYTEDREERNKSIGQPELADTPAASKPARKAPKASKQSIAHEVSHGANGIPYADIVSMLNESTSKNFKATTKETQKHISARWREGYRLEDFMRVVKLKTTQWAQDAEMERFLRPSTLFGTKMESYLNERGARQTVKRQCACGMELGKRDTSCPVCHQEVRVA